MAKKFSLTSTSKMILGHKVFQIKACAEFGNIAKGELGGWVEKEENLELDVSGDAWVFGDASVFGDAWVSGKLLLKAGFFFGMRYNNEEIKEFKVQDGTLILHKGNSDIEFYEGERPQIEPEGNDDEEADKIEETTTEDSAEEKQLEVTINGVIYVPKEETKES